MPELPEVEVAARALRRWLEGREVVAAEAAPTRVLRGGEAKDFARLAGRVASVERRGKYLLVAFEDGRGFVGHLGMTGKWVRRPSGVDEPYSRARLCLDDGHVLHYRDPRMFGRITPRPAASLAEDASVKALGVDPLEDGLSVATLRGAVRGTTRPLKVALMDQSRVAGLGNIHAAEALYRARLHPSRAPASLSDAEWRALHRGIHAALRYALEHAQGDEISYVEEPGAPNPFLVYGRKGERCRKCGSPFASFVQGGRTTWYCPGCQPPRPGAAKRGVRAPRRRKT
ncbi:MAG: bifunctional DNA-formamidopyrimidine glycosylase/DNA-(apurinic or apyrimidinic site) lyase [Pseudomonadota bacterium]|jgi:formamidopyrimidine-DNA glycosylase